jgi:3-oxoadipate enol-lactonase
MKSGYIKVRNGKLFYELSGEGKSLIFLHDGFLHRETWDEQFSAFAQDFQVIRYDRRGYGLSERPTIPYSNINDLHSIFEGLNIGCAGLIGCSSGGELALDFTLAYPEKVKALVLAGPVMGGFGFSDHFMNRGGHKHASDTRELESAIKYWCLEDPYLIGPGNSVVRNQAKSLLDAHQHNLDWSNFRLYFPHSSHQQSYLCYRS